MSHKWKLRVFDECFISGNYMFLEFPTILAEFQYKFSLPIIIVKYRMMKEKEKNNKKTPGKPVIFND